MKYKILLFGLSFFLMTATVYASGDELVSDKNRITISPLFFGPPTHEYPFEEEITEKRLSRILQSIVALNGAVILTNFTFIFCRLEDTVMMPRWKL